MPPPRPWKPQLLVPGTTTLDQVTDEAVLAIWHAQQAQSWTTNIIGGFEKVLTDAGLLRIVFRPPAICLLDLTGYTRLTHERGDDAAADLAERLGRLVNRSTLERGGRPVKWLGDGVMVHFRDPGSGVLAALEMVEGVARCLRGSRPGLRGDRAGGAQGPLGRGTPSRRASRAIELTRSPRSAEGLGDESDFRRSSYLG